MRIIKKIRPRVGALALTVGVSLAGGCGVPTSSVGTAMPPRIQWNANFGYCGEVSIISAGLYFGQYMSQYDARAIASADAPMRRCAPISQRFPTPAGRQRCGGRQGDAPHRDPLQRSRRGRSFREVRGLEARVAAGAGPVSGSASAVLHSAA